MDFRIHIFCGTTNLCKLIRKSFAKESFTFNCTEVKDKQFSDISEEINYRPDCIIVDKDIDTYFRDKIVKKFPDSKIVLLPSLDEVELKSSTNNVFQISEPFKLSELGEVLKEIYHSRQSEESIF
ncbi:MAG: hypothetical protein NTU73_02510 [Ignavibacteriae bacterium]|nr:hypothetical protein [Ignavibacteriota bacterium]